MRLLRRPASVAALAVAATGCYTLQPVAGGAPAPGQRVAFDVSDVGRVALGGAIGPSISRIEGRLVRRDSAEYVLAVSSVDFFAGGSQAWSGESVTLKPEYVARTYERRLSKARTLAAAAVGVGAIAFLATRSLTGGGSDTRDPIVEPPGTSFVPRRP